MREHGPPPFGGRPALPYCPPRGQVNFVLRPLIGLYGFDFRKQIMHVDEYDVLEDGYQLTRATPEELAAGMEDYRDGVYDDPWEEDETAIGPFLLGTEGMLMEHLQSKHGVSWEDLEEMDNDERNVLLIQNAIEAIDDPDVDLGRDMSEYRSGPVMADRLDEAIRDENALRDRVQSSPAAAVDDAWKRFGEPASKSPAAPGASAASGKGRTSVPDRRRGSGFKGYRVVGGGGFETSKEDAGPSL